jgi:hypothetical protein
MPSGVSPNELWESPENYGKLRCGINIPNAEEVAEELRGELTHTREEVFKWVSDEFRQAVEAAYDSLGRPVKTMTGGWDLFSNLVPLLHNLEFEE